MNRIWFAVFVLLVLGIFAGLFSGGDSFSGSVVINLPPVWDYPADDFVVDDVLFLDLNKAFFNPDRSPLVFSVESSDNVDAGISNNMLVVKLNGDLGYVFISAGDGISSTVKKIVLRKRI